MRGSGVLILLLAACAPVEELPGGEPAPQPFHGKLDAPGADQADRSCRVILRAVDGLLVDVDVVAWLGAPGHLLARVDDARGWTDFPGLELSSDTAGLRRFRVRLPETTRKA